MKHNSRIIFTVTLLLLSYNISNGQNVHIAGVSYNTIAEAVAGASSGDTIIVGQGVFSEQLIINKNLVITGAGIDKTIIREDAAVPDSTIIFINNSNVTLNNIQFYGGGDSDRGRRGVIGVNSSLNILNCAFVQCFNVSLASVNGILNADNVIITCIRNGNVVSVDSSFAQGPGLMLDIGIIIVNSQFTVNNFTGGAAIDHIIDIRPDLNDIPTLLGKVYPVDTTSFSSGTIMNSKFYGSRLSYWGQGIRITGSLKRHRPEIIIKKNYFKGQVTDSTHAVPSLYTTAAISFNGANGFAEIFDNQMSNFNTGICLYGLATASIYNNNISHNGRYGIVTSWGGNLAAQPDLGGGEYNSPGKNTISNNGLYNILNLNSLPLWAINNSWGTADSLKIDSLIYDDNENPLIGKVTFSPYADPVVPVELTSFSVSVAGTNACLKWSTATETNNMGFDIERKSEEGNNSNAVWLRVGFVPGSGTSFLIHNYSYTDKDLSSGKYSYRLKQINYDGTFVYYNCESLEISLVKNFHLAQNYPNPFNPSTTITYQLPKDGMVTLKIYDATGTEVTTLVNEYKPTGRYNVTFNASNLASGVYFYRLQVNDFTSSKKLILMK